MNLAHELQNLARQLDEDPAVLVYAWIEPNKGVSEDDLASAERRMKVKLPEALRSFYQTMNGFGIVWVHESDFEDARENLRLGNRPFKATRTLHRKKVKYPWTKGADESRFDIHAEVSRLDHRDTGHIRIPALKHFVKDPVFSSFTKAVAEVEPPVMTTFDDEKLPLPELYKRFHVLDRYAWSEQAFLYLGPGDRHLRVHRMANNYELSDYDPHLDIITYFEAILGTQGRIHARRAIFEKQ